MVSSFAKRSRYHRFRYHRRVLSDLVFARTWQNNREPVSKSFDALTRFLSKRLGRRVVPRVSLSYEELSRGLREGTVDFAWLPPIVHARLARGSEVRTMLVSAREQRSSCVIVCKRGGRIGSVDDVRTSRAAWVDPWSAAGYVMPRLFLFEHYIDPRTDLLEERFLGSHEAAVRAVADGVADIAATFARLDERGEIVAAGWSGIPDCAQALRVVSVVGSIPPDVLACRTSLAADVSDAMSVALLASLELPDVSANARASFEVDGFASPTTNEASLALLASLEKAGSLFPR